MIPHIHTLFSGISDTVNLLNNGGFTQYSGRWSVLENTSSDRSVGSVDVIDQDQYRVGQIGFISADTNRLGMWELSGVRCGLTVAPTRQDGTTITSNDGGNVLKISFLDNGEFVLTQTLHDTKRFYSTPISVACSGITIEGSPVVRLVAEINGTDTEVVVVSSNAFGTYRRFGDYITLPAVVSSLKIKIKIVGCFGEEVGLSGMCAVLGHKTKSIPFSSSLVDRACPSGIVFMVAGESCPVGYREYTADPSMVLVSGTKATQQFEHKAVRSLGFDEHDHSESRVDNIRPPTDNLAETTVPLIPSDTRLVMGADFHRYPSDVPFTPYNGEVPVIVLGPNHSHKLRSRMSNIPPTFPVKYCIKL